MQSLLRPVQAIDRDIEAAAKRLRALKIERALAKRAHYIERDAAIVADLEAPGPRYGRQEAVAAKHGVSVTALRNVWYAHLRRKRYAKLRAVAIRHTAAVSP